MVLFFPQKFQNIFVTIPRPERNNNHTLFSCRLWTRRPSTPPLQRLQRRRRHPRTGLLISIGFLCLCVFVLWNIHVLILYQQQQQFILSPTKNVWAYFLSGDTTPAPLRPTLPRIPPPLTYDDDDATNPATRSSEAYDLKEPPYHDLSLGSLQCQPYGGPRTASEMVYWKNISSDAAFQSPLKKQQQQQQQQQRKAEERQFLTFEPGK